MRGQKKKQRNRKTNTRGKTRVSFFAICLAAVMALPPSFGTIHVSAAGAGQTERSYLVMAEGRKDNQQIQDDYQGKIKDRTPLEQTEVLYRMRLTKAEADELADTEGVRQVEPNISLNASTTNRKADPVPAGTQWNLDAIGADGKAAENTGKTIKVAVMDSGISASENLAVTERVDFTTDADIHPMYDDVMGHGTAVAGIIAAKSNGNGVAGINPQAALYSVKVLDETLSGTLEQVVKGIYWCIDHDIDIINMSFGTTTYSRVLEQAVRDAEDAGILLVAAAGNRGENTEGNSVEYPAAFSEVIAVGSANGKSQKSTFSANGAQVELMAPGEDIPVTGFLDEVLPADGTSMAAPHVTGAASVLWGNHPEQDAGFIRRLLQAGAREMEGQDSCGSGLIDLDYTLSIGDSFAEASCSQPPEKAAEGFQNPNKLPQYTKQEIQANWSKANHQKTVDLYGDIGKANDGVVKRALRACDEESYLKFEQGTGQIYFHGHGNYVCNYLYLIAIAQKCYTSGLDAALKVPYPGNNTEQKQGILNGISKVRKNWGKFLTNVEVPKHAKASFLMGMAVHLGMDVYAHKTYVKKKDIGISNSSAWFKLEGGKDGYSQEQDDTSIVPCRWTCAKGLAKYTYQKWKDGGVYTAGAYGQSAHDPNRFKLYKFKEYIKIYSTEYYTKNKNWIDSRSRNDND